MTRVLRTGATDETRGFMKLGLCARTGSRYERMLSCLQWLTSIENALARPWTELGRPQSVRVFCGGE